MKPLEVVNVEVRQLLESEPILTADSDKRNIAVELRPHIRAVEIWENNDTVTVAVPQNWRIMKVRHSVNNILQVLVSDLN